MFALCVCVCMNALEKVKPLSHCVGIASYGNKQTKNNSKGGGRGGCKGSKENNVHIYLFI